ncbi:MAG: hypothetical protein FGM32_02930 [Candidatus Kapabacteria bacterium]|nr:hypothetical protein [Candidatus Kapabacteria bacterium]
MRHAIAASFIAFCCLCGSPRTSADTLAAKKYIVENYVTPLPKGIETLPWDEFAKYLDPYTYIFSPEQVRNWDQRFSGGADGELGFDYDWRRRGWVIKDITPNSPAYDMGLLPGDVVTSVDGISTVWPNEYGRYVSASGEPGTWVMLDVRRGDTCFQQPMPFAAFPTQTVYVSVINRTMCVVVLGFNSGTYDRFVELTRHIQDEDIDTIILDLRDNGGGVVSEATDLMSEFIPDGDTLLVEQYRQRSNAIHSHGNGRWRRMRPTYVLLSDETVSAGEIFVGGISVRTNAVLIGSTTYGKGRIQRLVRGLHATSFADSVVAAVKITVARYLAGGTMTVDSIGVTPHMLADLSLPPIVGIPPTIDVPALRLRVTNPTRATIDSINRVAGKDVAYMIWCQRVRPFEAYRAIDTMRSRLIVKPFTPSPNYAESSMYTRADEPEIVRALHERYTGVMDASFARDMSVHSMMKRLRQLPPAAVPASDVIEADARRPVACDLGLVLTTVSGAIIVARVHPRSSAYYAGVCAGDRLLAMNRKPLDKELENIQVRIIQLVRDRQPVVLTVRRGQRELTVTCDANVRIVAVPLTYQAGSVGYIATDRFCTSDAGDYQMRRSLNAFRDRGVRTVVFDLRGSQVGDFTRMLTLLATFHRMGDTMAVARFNDGATDHAIITRHGDYREWAVYVVVDSATKGAAEVFAASIKRRGNSMIIGQTTAGELAQRRMLEISPQISIGYIWSRFHVGSDARVQPDVTMHLPLSQHLLVQNVSSLVPEMMNLRNADLCSDHVCLDAQLDKLPADLLAHPRSVLAEAIYGDGARLYNLSKALAPIIGGTVSTGR